MHSRDSSFWKVGYDSASHVPARPRATAAMGSGKEKMVDRADHRTSHAARSHETRHKQWT